MRKPKKSKEERQRDRNIVDRYHQKVTEDALEPLYQDFQKWKNGQLAYDDLTEKIHEFHKKNQQIWTMFNYNGWDDEFLIFQAKKELDLLNNDDRIKYQNLLKEWE